MQTKRFYYHKEPSFFRVRTSVKLANPQNAPDGHSISSYDSIHSKGLDMHNRWAMDVILFFCDPHFLRGAQGRPNGPANPNGVFPLRWCRDCHLHGVWYEGSQLFLHSGVNPRVHGGTTRENYVLVQVFADVNICLHD